MVGDWKIGLGCWMGGMMFRGSRSGIQVGGWDGR